MASKCINYDCPIVKLYGQICTTMYPEHKALDNVSRPFKLEKMEPHKGSDDRYYCYQFGD